MKKIIPIICVVCIWILSCTKTINTPKYYILEFDAQQTQTENTLVNEVCEILPATVSEVFAQHRIALRKRSHEISYYHYHKWAESPDVNIERLIQKKLSSDKLFSRVSGDVWNVAAQYQLMTTILYLEAVEGEDDLFAHIGLKLEIFNRKNNEIVVEHDFDRVEVLEDWDLNLMSLTMSTILKEELDTFSGKIRDYLTNVQQ